MADTPTRAAEVIADHFDHLIQHCDREGRPRGLGYVDRVIYYVVAVRSEMDINGFASVFEQLLSDEELEFFVNALTELQEPKLALSFQRAQHALEASGWWQANLSRLAECSEALDRQICGIEEAVRDQDRLWDLNRKLLVLLDRGAELSHAPEPAQPS